jgi:hypothetical protein
MGRQITVTISEQIYKQAQHLAKQQHRSVADIVSESIVLTPSPEVSSSKVVDLSEPDETVEQEMLAYLDMHPTLWEQYPGQYVAIYQRQLIDHDDHLEALYERIDSRYPDEFVWITRVEFEPIKTVHIPSFQLDLNSER